MKKISICIPCYKSENIIEHVTNEITISMKSLKNFSYEIILVNDGSPDNTFDVISKLAKKDSHIIAIDLAKNFGQSSALLASYHVASGDYIVTMDDDGEHNPKDIITLIKKLEEGYDYVCADFKHRNHSLYKRLGSKFNYWFLSFLMDVPKGTILSSFNIMKKYIMDEIINYPNPKPYVDGMVWAITNKVASVPVEHCQRYAGESGYNLIKSIRLWLNGATSYSVKPLRLASLFGFITASIGAIGIIFVIIDTLINPSSPEGWASLLVVLLFIGGAIMIFLGLLGEYVGRGYLISNRIPQYVVREKVVAKKGRK